MRLPVFQLTWTQRNEKVGLVFPSELSYETQDFAFFIPVLKEQVLNNDTSFDYVHFIIKNKYYFPCEINGKYVEITSEVDLNSKSKVLAFVFQTSNKGSFEFQFVLHAFSELDHNGLFCGLDFLEYLGNFKKEFFKHFVFLQLRPVNIKLMNNFYLEEKGILVGYTSEFGVFPDKEFWNFLI